MNALARHIAARIRAAGPMSVAEYLGLALFHPEHGYYMTRDPLGRAGDFTTAPEISQMFGELIGLWCVASWRGLGRPAPFALVELGPGRGTLMVDALRAAKLDRDFLAALRLHLVEIGPVLQDRQRAALAAFDPVWIERFEEVPEMPFLALANEFFDALPVRHLVRTKTGFAERLIDADTAGGFRFVAGPGPSPWAALVPEGLRGAGEGSVIEVCPAGIQLARAMAERLARQGGAALIVDYGSAESRAGPTLQALRGHARHDPLVDPGTADLTAHVDFAALARAGTEAGASVAGPVAQRDFLLRLGIVERAGRLMRDAPPDARARIAGERDRLIDAADMGTLFKVLGLARAGAPLSGFA